MKLKFVHSAPLDILFCLVCIPFLAKVKFFIFRLKTMDYNYVVRRFDQN